MSEMVDQSGWPPHLRDDAPYLQCDVCQRKTWAPTAHGTRCEMPQPNGKPCHGHFLRAVEDDAS